VISKALDLVGPAIILAFVGTALGIIAGEIAKAIIE
jgi:hypothetical protein